MSSPANPDSIPSAAPPKRRGVLRVLLWTLASLVGLVVVLVLLFLLGIPLPGDRLRAPLEDLLSVVFSVPTRIEGPLRLRTGLVASADAGALILADPSNPAGPPLARADGVSVRIDVLALLRRTVILEEISGKQVEVRLARSAEGRGNWAPVIATSGGPAPVQFVGIGQLKISSLKGSFAGQPEAEPVRWVVKELEGTLLGRNPITAQGSLSFGDRTLAINASTASLAELIEGPPQTIPVKAAIKTSDTQVRLDGSYALSATTLNASVDVKADDGDAALASIGVEARKSGALDVRGRMQLRTHDVAIDELMFRLGKTSVSGRVRVDWAQARPLVSLDLSGEDVDGAPFVTGAGHAQGKTAIEGYVQLLHELTTSIDLDAKASVNQLSGLTILPVRNYSGEVQIRDSVLTVRSGSDVLGMRSHATLEYAARAPKRVLTIHIEAKRASSGKPPQGVQFGAVSATAGTLRMDLHGTGSDTRELVGSANVNLDARDLQLSWLDAAKRRTDLLLNSARIEIRSGRSARSQVRGRLSGYPCSLNVAGGTLVSLISGERWPLQLDASCAGAKLVSRGHVVMKGRETTAGLEFNASANPIGPFAGAIGLAKEAKHAFAASGELTLTERLARAKLSRFRLGATTGSGTVALVREGKEPHRFELLLSRVDVVELAKLAPGKKTGAQVDPLSKEVLPGNAHIPDLDLQLTAGTVRYGDEVLRKLDVSAKPREGHLRDAHFEFQWRGASVSGDLSADLRGARPMVALNAAVENADLARALEGGGHAMPPLRAEKIRATARASGVKLGDLLASTTAEAEIFKGRLGKMQQLVPGLIGDAEFSAKLSVKEKQPVKMSARGTMGDEPFEMSIDTEPLEKLAQREGRLPGRLHASLGEIRLEASGDISTNGKLDAHVTLSGRRLERLGRLGGVQFPDVEPYSATADLAVSPGSISATGVDAKFGKSQVLGKVSMNRSGTRPAIAADLRAPILHLEDLGLHVLLGTGGKQKTAKTSAPTTETDTAQKIAQFENSLRALDAKATLNVEALYSEGKRYASLRTSAALRDGNMHVAVHDMYVSGGKANADLHIDASVSGTRLHLRAFTEGFEYGPLAEALKPNTPLEGTLDLSLNASLESLHEPLFGDLDGHVSLAVFPRGLNVGAADYWGTGLLHMMQSTVDRSSESRLNCAVAIFDIKKGVARSEAFFADTTRVRIIGELEANLVTRQLSGRLSPNAKNPALLTVSPSVGIGGTLESPKIELTPDSLITAPLRLIFPIHAFAFNWLSATGVSADGSDGCRQAFKQAISVDPKKPPPPPAQPSPSFWPF